MNSDITNTTLLTAAFLIGMLLTLVLIPKIIHWATKNNELDIPNWRSAHKTPIPSYGGLCFSISILICSFLFISTKQTQLLVGCILGISLLGFLDDKINLKARVKFLIQFIFATTIYLIGFRITNLHGILGIYEVSTLIGYLLTLTFIVGVTNAFNLIDGVDGLAGGLGLISNVTFAIIFTYFGKFDLAIISLALAGSISGFLKFNSSPARIFMGDSGSLVIGIVSSVLFIEALAIQNSTAIACSASTLLIPCIDMVRLFAVRILKGYSPFKADHNHYHHLLLKAGDNHKKVSLTLYILTTSLIFIAFGLDHYCNLNNNILSLLIISLTIYVWIEFRFYINTRKEDKLIQNSMLRMIEKNKLLNRKL